MAGKKEKSKERKSKTWKPIVLRLPFAANARIRVRPLVAVVATLVLTVVGVVLARWFRNADPFRVNPSLAATAFQALPRSFLSQRAQSAAQHEQAGRVTPAAGQGVGVGQNSASSAAGDPPATKAATAGDGAAAEGKPRDADQGPKLEAGGQSSGELRGKGGNVAGISSRAEIEGLSAGSAPQEVARGNRLAHVVDRVGGREKRVIATSVTSGYLDFLENWVASVSRFGYLDKILFLAEDEGAFEYISRKWPAQVVKAYEVVKVRKLPKEGSKKDKKISGSAIFNTLLGRRPSYFRALIDLNVTFLFNDVDVVWMKDPFPSFKGEYDIWMPEDTSSLSGFRGSRFRGNNPGRPVLGAANQLSCSLMMVRPTKESMKLVKRWSKRVKGETKEHGRPVETQREWNKAVQEQKDNGAMIGVLPVTQFPSGCIWFAGPSAPGCDRSKRETFVRGFKSWPSEVVAIHNNFLKGHDEKLWRFRDQNLWLLNDTTSTGSLQVAAQ